MPETRDGDEAESKKGEIIKEPLYKCGAQWKEKE
jgi:hypothetical protein